MAKYGTLKKNGEKFYPVTRADLVFDEEGNNINLKLDNIENEIKDLTSGLDLSELTMTISSVDEGTKLVLTDGTTTKEVTIPSATEIQVKTVVDGLIADGTLNAESLFENTKFNIDKMENTYVEFNNSVNMYNINSSVYNGGSVPTNNFTFDIDDESYYIKLPNIVQYCRKNVFTFNLYLLDANNSLILSSLNTNAIYRDTSNYANYIYYSIYNENNRADGDIIIKIKRKTSDVDKIILQLNSDIIDINNVSVYKRIIENEKKIKTLFGYDIDYFSKDFSTKMLSYNNKYKNFKGIYHREEDGKGYMFSSVIYNSPYAGAGSFIENTYYQGEKGDYYLYLDDFPKLLDDSVAKKGDIVYFDGSKLHAEFNPYYREGNNLMNPTQQKYDICIVGGGSGGIGAAYALKNSGLKVCLVERLDSLGGTNLNGGVPRQIASPVGDWYKEICKRAYQDGAISIDGFTSSSLKKYGTDDESEFDKKWRASLWNKGSSGANLGNLTTLNNYYMSQFYDNDLKDYIDIKYNRECIDNKVVGDTLVSATFRNTITGAIEVICADFFIDCTGNNNLLRLNKNVGTDYFIGSDPKELYNESAINDGAIGNKYELNTLEPAYEIATTNNSYSISRDGKSASSTDTTNFPTIEGITTGVNHKIYTPVAIKDFNNVGIRIPYNGFTQIISPDYRAGITAQDYVDYGYDYCHYKGLTNAKAHFKLNFNGSIFLRMMPLIAQREGYRMKCDYMLTQSDVEETITQDNYVEKEIIALSSWYADMHKTSVTSVDYSKVNNTMKNGIPYKALIPSCYKNALVGCRGLGASHVAGSAFRLIRTMLSVGYACGKALELAVNNQLTDVRNVDITQLQTAIGILDTLKEMDLCIYYANPQPCESITLDKTSLNFTNMDPQTLTPTITPTNCADSVVWSSDDTTIATVENGIVTPVNNGSCTITATCGEHSVTCSVSINVTYDVTGISLNKASDKFYLSDASDIALSATITPSFATNQNVVWNSSNESVATVVGNGLNATVSIKGVGECQITCTSEDTTNGTISASYSLNILDDSDKYSASIKYDFTDAVSKINERKSNWSSDKSDGIYSIPNIGSLGEVANTNLKITSSSGHMAVGIKPDDTSIAISKRNTFMWVIKDYTPVSTDSGNIYSAMSLNSVGGNNMPSFQYNKGSMYYRYGAASGYSGTSETPKYIVIGYDSQGYYLWIDGEFVATGGSSSSSGYIKDITGLLVSSLLLGYSDADIEKNIDFIQKLNTAVYENPREDIIAILTKDFGYTTT